MFNQYHYLYVDDDALSREIMRVAMQTMMDVRSLVLFEDSSDFMQRLNALPRRPDVILLDIQVAPLDGTQLLDLIRADPAYHSAKVLALSASVINEAIEHLRAIGFDGAIAKPLDIVALPGLIEQILAGKAVWHIA